VEGKLYYISRASLKPANKRFTSVAHDYEMTLNSDTQIERADEEELAASGKKVTIPTAKFNFCKLSELIGEHGVDSLVDVVGVVHNHQPVQEITARSTGKVSTKRELQIVDDSNTQVAVTRHSVGKRRCGVRAVPGLGRRPSCASAERRPHHRIPAEGASRCVAEQLTAC
jgi:ssDNA-binding replication factor A large subunit